MGFQPLIPCPWPASECTSAASCHAHPAAPFLRPSAAGATAAPATAALLSPSTRGRSLPPPAPASTVATASPSPCRGAPQEPLTAGASSHGATHSCGTSGTTPSDPAGSLRLGIGCARGVPPPPRAGGGRGEAARCRPCGSSSHPPPRPVRWPAGCRTPRGACPPRGVDAARTARRGRSAARAGASTAAWAAARWPGAAAGASTGHTGSGWPS
jgi:hypothetical protein